MAKTPPTNVFKKRPSAAASRKKLMDKLDKERVKNTSARAAKKGASTDTLTQRMGDARKSRGPYPVPAVRKENAVKPYTEPKRDIVKYEEPKRGVVKYEPKQAATAAGNAVGRTFGRGAARVLGPVGALVAMTKPAGAPEESSSVKRDRSYGPLMKGNAAKPDASKAKSNDYDKAYQSMKRAGMDRPYDVRTAPSVTKKPTLRPADLKTATPKKTVGKSKTRIAFEKEFAANRKAGKKTFAFRGKSYNTKLAK